VKQTLQEHGAYAQTAAEILKEELVNGSSLLNLSEEKLIKEYGIKKGPANNLANAIEKLKPPKGNTCLNPIRTRFSSFHYDRVSLW
jgi:hypothetical protein